MSRIIYELEYIPDLTLNKYSGFSDSGVQGLIERHGSFWRQLYSHGYRNKECFHLCYIYDPRKVKGKREKAIFCIDTEDDEYIRQIIASSALSSYYDLFEIRDYSGSDWYTRGYKCAANLIKGERFIKPLFSERKLYTTSVWEMHPAARLYQMHQLMASMDKPCLYCASIQPVNFTDKIEQDLAGVINVLRREAAYKTSVSASGSTLSEKDANADYALKYYVNTVDEVTANPHFIVSIQAYADDMKIARNLLDSAASEALKSGKHSIVSYQGNYSIGGMDNRISEYCADLNAEKSIAYLPHLFTLEEVTPFAILPSLYLGENIEIPKETTPTLFTNGIYLGKTEQGYDVNMPLSLLSKHAFFSGVPGSGKTNGMMHAAVSLLREYNIPFLILEPAKQEYRAMASLRDLTDLIVFSPSIASSFPLHINPFEFPLNMILAEHIRNLLDVFAGTFSLEPPMPYLLDAAVEEIYRDYGWNPGTVNNGKLAYPTMSDLYNKIEKKLNETDYDPDVRNNLKSILQVRIGSLLRRELGTIFDVSRSTILPNEWVKISAIIELETLGNEPANFMTLVLATLIRETLKVEPYDSGKNAGRPRHIMFLEEAHNLIGPSTVADAGNETNPKIAATNFIVKMLAEVRSLGEAIIIADQLPTEMAPEVLKNTSLKVGLKLTAADDRSLLGSIMSADQLQLERMGIFEAGHALVMYDNVVKPFEVQMPYLSVKEGLLDDNDLLICLIDHQRFWETLNKSVMINVAKWKRKAKEIAADREELLRTVKTEDRLYNYIDEVRELCCDIRLYRENLSALDNVMRLLSTGHINQDELHMDVRLIQQQYGFLLHSFSIIPGEKVRDDNLLPLRKELIEAGYKLDNRFSDYITASIRNLS